MKPSSFLIQPPVAGGKSEKRILRIWYAFAGLIPDKKQNDE
jgi:hypothetical protein